MMHFPTIRRLHTLTDTDVDQLSDVLIDCVDGGASVSFMHPLTPERAAKFWRQVARDVAAGRRALLVAHDEQGICGTVQLVLDLPENQPHRADLGKMLVHRRGRRRGLGEALMRAAEELARQCGRTLLVLDAVTGGDAARLYERLGWVRVGDVPNFALLPRGGQCSTTYYYRDLDTPPAASDRAPPIPVSLEVDMVDPVRVEYLRDSLATMRKYKAMADASLGRVSDDQFFHALDGESNSLAALVKHLAGNLRSRWTDLLTTDGEKPDRDRDSEFEVQSADTRAALLQRWEEGWSRALESLEALTPDDLDRVIRIRGEPHTLVQAINRQLTHTAYHVGQMVFLAKHFRSDGWESLSIPRGRSREYNAGISHIA